MSVGLAMIVRNEERMIRSCLDSVRDIIDYWSIVDTGSTDGTPEIIEEVLSEHIPGVLHRREFVDFGTNRTEVLDLARGSADWLLLLDADMILKAYPNLREWLDPDPSPLTDAWMVEVLDQGLSYRLPLLVRGNLEWRYVGVTHEYMAPIRNRRHLTGVVVHHHANGSNRAGKLERDLQLLLDEVEKVPDDPRSWFYLAQTYRDLGQTAHAIAAYEKRAQLGGWEEEEWYAHYQAALLRRDVEELLAVWRARPHRHEPLKAAAALIRGTPHEDILFVETT